MPEPCSGYAEYGDAVDAARYQAVLDTLPVREASAIDRLVTANKEN